MTNPPDRRVYPGEMEASIPANGESIAAARARPSPESRLLARVAAGSRDALAALYERLAGELYALALWRTGSAADAADAVQEVFVRLAGRGERLLAVKSPRAYLLRMTHRAAIDLHRRSGRHAAEPLDGLVLAAADRDPIAVVDAGRVSRCLHRLSAAQREAIYLRHFAGLTFAEIGRVAGVPTFTAASRYRLGIARVRRWLGVEER